MMGRFGFLKECIMKRLFLLLFIGLAWEQNPCKIID